VYPGEEFEVVYGHLFGLDAQFMVQLAHCCATHALDRFLQTNASLSWYA
jgi:hypothetical protein